MLRCQVVLSPQWDGWVTLAPDLPFGHATAMKLRSLLPTVLLLLLPACETSVYRVDLGLMLSKHRGSVALQDAGGSLSLGEERNDLDRTLGLGDAEPSPYLRFQWDESEHRVRAHGFGFEGGGRGVLDGDFGGIEGGSVVDTSMQFFTTGASYSYGVLQNELFRIGVGGQLTYVYQKFAVRGASGREQISTDVLIPMPYADAELYLGEQVTLGGSAGLMYADLGDGKGRYWDVEAWGRWQVTEALSLMLGYRYILQDTRGQANGRDFDADLNVQGLFLGGGLKF